MNKVVALLGIIVLLTVGALLFCVGFFTATTLSPQFIDPTTVSEADKSLTMKEVDDVIDTQSASISDKIMDMISYAASTAASSIQKRVSRIQPNKRQNDLMNESQITVDSLLREIASRHSINDECSYKDTVKKIKEHKRESDKKIYTLDGKKIVFIGYFKNRVALQIQKLLISRGYKAHVEISKTGDGHESFIFCGPFKKEAHAQALLDWLLKHDFSDARILSVTKEIKGQSLYESISEDVNMPVNVEENIEKLEKVDQTLEEDEGEEEDSEESPKKTKKKTAKVTKTERTRNQQKTLQQQQQMAQLQQQNMMMNPNMARMMNMYQMMPNNRAANNQNLMRMMNANQMTRAGSR